MVAKKRRQAKPAWAALQEIVTRLAAGSGRSSVESSRGAPWLPNLRTPKFSLPRFTLSESEIQGPRLYSPLGEFLPPHRPRTRRLPSACVLLDVSPRGVCLHKTGAGTVHVCCVAARLRVQQPGAVCRGFVRTPQRGLVDGDPSPSLLVLAASGLRTQYSVSCSSHSDICTM